MLKIALTGGIACGKSTVSRFFEKLGVPIIDTDILSRQLVGPNTIALNEIKDVFGVAIIDNNDQLNRKLLRKIIFDSPIKRKLLESILHPKIQHLVKIQISELQQSETKVAYCIIVIPLLFETKSDYTFDRILVVDCTEQQQINRVMLRDNITQQQSQVILSTQISRTLRLEQADDIIENIGDISSLQVKLRQLHAKYLVL